MRFRAVANTLSPVASSAICILLDGLKNMVRTISANSYRPYAQVSSSSTPQARLALISLIQMVGVRSIGS
jgi:hypothetical protein